jgi:hypothetical protein
MVEFLVQLSEQINGDDFFARKKRLEIGSLVGISKSIDYGRFGRRVNVSE